MGRIPVDCAVVTALPEESAAVRAYTAAHPQSVRSGEGHWLWTGRPPAGTDVVMVATGAGKVAATATMTRFLEQYRPSVVIAAGIAGAVAGALHTGDLIHATRTTFYDVDATALGLPLGTLRRGASPVVDLSDQGKPFEHLHMIQDAAARCRDELRRPPSVHQGMITTGDTLLTRRTLEALPDDWRDRIGNALAVDMESAVWAALCREAGVPIVLFRLISDHVRRGEHMGFVRACEEVGAVLREVLRLRRE